MVPNYLINSVALVLMILTVTVYSFLSGIILVPVLIIDSDQQEYTEDYEQQRGKGSFPAMITPAYQRAKKANQLASQVSIPCLFTIYCANFCHWWNSGIQIKTSKRVLWMVGVISVILWRELCCYVFPLPWGKALSQEFILPWEILSALTGSHLSNGETS